MKSEEGDVVERRRIAACCWGEGRPATCLVMLDEQGSLVDILYLPSFSGPQRIIRTGLDYSIAEDPKKVQMPCPSVRGRFTSYQPASGLWDSPSPVSVSKSLSAARPSIQLLMA